MQDAGISLSFKIVNPGGVEIMATFRDDNTEEGDKRCFARVSTFIKNATNAGWTPVTVHKPSNQTAAPGKAPTAPTSAPAAATTQGQTGLSFIANTLTVEFTPKGEKAAKLKGGQFTKHGVRLWPEVAIALGYNLDNFGAGDHQIEPVPVCYALNAEQKPSKITGRAA
jgi:hypothetical protein